MGWARRAAIVGGSAAAAAAGASWYYSDRVLEAPADLQPSLPLPEDLVTIAEVSDHQVRLRGPDAERPGWWGLLTESGYAQAGPPMIAGDVVTRAITTLRGAIRTGETAFLDPYAYPENPDALGLEWHDDPILSPVGQLPAWRFPAQGRTWALFVHGRSARRHEPFRLLPTIVGAGLPGLVMSYRNDADAPRSDDSRSHLGDTEWEDVEAAVQHALGSGAEDVVLVGYSMGGAICLRFLAESRDAEHVRAMILEAPVLDWEPVLRGAARQRGMPGVVVAALIPPTLALTQARSGVNWQRLAMLHNDPSQLKVRTLLIHGVADETVPVELSDQLAEARPDLVTYLRVPDAGHVRSWNFDRPRVEAATASFLADL